MPTMSWESVRTLLGCSKEASRLEFYQRVLEGEQLGLVVGDEKSQRDSVDAKCLLCCIVLDHDSRPAGTSVSLLDEPSM